MTLESLTQTITVKLCIDTDSAPAMFMGQFHKMSKAILQMSHLMQHVFKTYKDMHTYQTVDLVREKQRKWLQFNHTELSIMDALHQLSNVLDESDPDIQLPNIYHAYQTAERIREVHPQEDWLQLTGLIHDLGKVMYVWGEPQWCVVGDTFPVGCRPADSVVFQKETFAENVDMKNPEYNTKYGMYQPGCGLSNLLMSWGHDEYLYQVLKNHKECTLPFEALYIIRFHSFYPWHTGHDYWNFLSKIDHEMYHWVREFNKFDLYSKTESVLDIEQIRPYYQALADKYIPGKVRF